MEARDDDLVFDHRNADFLWREAIALQMHGKAFGRVLHLQMVVSTAYLYAFVRSACGTHSIVHYSASVGLILMCEIKARLNRKALTILFSRSEPSSALSLEKKSIEFEEQ